MVNEEKTRPESGMSSRTVSSTSLNSADARDSLDSDSDFSTSSSDESEDEDVGKDVEKGNIENNPPKKKDDSDSEDSLDNDMDDKDDKDSLDSDFSD